VKERLGALIANAAPVVFILSPASAKSDVRAWDARETAYLSKRISPVLVRLLEGIPALPRLATLNYVRLE
jgi:hypothetical protein